MRSWSDLGDSAQSEPQAAAVLDGVRSFGRNTVGIDVIFPAVPVDIAAGAANRYPLLKHKHINVAPEYLCVLLVLAAHAHTKPAILQDLVNRLEESVMAFEKGL
jgi:hypothetical protein